MKVLSVGYPRTGTRTLWRALSMLGFNALHHDDERVPMFPPVGFDFRVYDDVDAATEEVYWREVADAYLGAKLILTVRDMEAWWASVRYVVNENRTIHGPREIDRFDHIQRLLYGSASPVEYLYKKRHREHVEAVMRYAAGRSLLVLDVCGGDGWSVLCPFVGVPVPNKPFPWANKREP